MKKMPTLFSRTFEGHNIVHISDEVTPGLEWVLRGEGQATVKWDGTAVAFIGGKYYKRYDAKGKKKPPEGAIECSPADPITGHHPYWVPVLEDDPSSRWHLVALQNHIDRFKYYPVDGTYEAIGIHFNGNPYNIFSDILIKHGTDILYVERSFEGIKQYLAEHEIEGIVFWKDGQPQCKIKRSDFGFEWNNRHKR